MYQDLKTLGNVQTNNLLNKYDPMSDEFNKKTVVKI